jgi:hypothetical protein
MAGSGGFKHRLTGVVHRKHRRHVKAAESVRRAQGLFESKGQTWDPKNNPQQMAALNHEARRLMARSDYFNR